MERAMAFVALGWLPVSQLENCFAAAVAVDWTPYSRASPFVLVAVSY